MIWEFYQSPYRSLKTATWDPDTWGKTPANTLNRFFSRTENPPLMFFRTARPSLAWVSWAVSPSCAGLGQCLCIINFCTAPNRNRRWRCDVIWKLYQSPYRPLKTATWDPDTWGKTPKANRCSMMFIMSGRNWSHKSSQILALNLLNLQEWNMWNPNTKIKYRATGPCLVTVKRSPWQLRQDTSSHWAPLRPMGRMGHWAPNGTN